MYSPTGRRGAKPSNPSLPLSFLLSLLFLSFRVVDAPTHSHRRPPREYIRLGAFVMVIG